MSLIHEALKKAEQQRQLGQPPNLSTPFAAVRRRRSSVPAILVLIVLVLAVGWWRSMPPRTTETEQTPEVAVAPTATTESVRPAAGTDGTDGAAITASSTAAERRPQVSGMAVTSLPMTAVGRANATPLGRGAAPPAASPSPQELAERESEPHPAGANPLAPGELPPQSLGTQAVDDAALNEPDGVAIKSASKKRAGEPVVYVPDPAAAQPATAPTASKPLQPAQTAGSPDPNATPPARPPVATVTTPPVAPPASSAAPKSKADSVTPPASAPASFAPTPMMWELPLNLRKDLPALNLTMHVYSAQPVQRFVVINGNRQVEGDELGDDMVLREIRTDGVVLEFRGQRFLIPRGGT